MTTPRLDPLWSHVHGLTVLGDLGSYTAAAQRLGLSKAAMSQHIAMLERATGVPLVQRTTRSVRLTEAGQQLVDSTRSAFEQIERGLSGIRDLAEQPSGLLRLTLPVALGRQIIVPHLPAFLQAYPDVRLELNLSDHLASLAQEGFDLAIRHTEHPPENCVAWRLRETHAVLVGAPDYLTQHGHPQHPAELSRHNCLHYVRPGGSPMWQFRELASTSDHASHITVALHGPLSANNSEVLREAALAGLGIALLPDFSADPALAAGALVQVLPQWRSVGAFGGHIYALRPYSAHVPRAVHALVQHLRQQLETPTTLTLHSSPSERR